MRELYAPAEQSRIAEAIAAAETRTSGEIVCVVARASSEYRSFPLLWAAVAALILPWPLNRFTLLDPGSVHLAQLLTVIALSALLALLPDRLWLVPRIVARSRASRAARDQFAARGIAQTEGRTGVLIYLSLAERFVEVVADEAIAAKVDQAVWRDAVAAIADAIHAGAPADGLVSAIGLCGAVLADHFPPLPEDRNELPNHLIML